MISWRLNDERGVMTRMERTPDGPGAAGDLSALYQDLSTLYEEMIDSVYGFAATRVGRSDAEEIAAEVFCAAAAAYRAGRAAEVTPAWLMTVARNKVIDRWRSTAIRSSKLHLLRPQVPDHNVWTSNDTSWRVVDALDRLDDLSRTVLVLRYVEGHTVPEIAHRLGRSTKATNSVLGRARKKLQRAYERAGVDDGRA